MPGEVIDRANPQALPSHLPDTVDKLLVELEKTTLDHETNHALLMFRRAANYIAAGWFTSRSLGIAD